MTFSAGCATVDLMFSREIRGEIHACNIAGASPSSIQRTFRTRGVKISLPTVYKIIREMSELPELSKQEHEERAAAVVTVLRRENDGVTYAEIARHLRLDEDELYYWMDRWRSGACLWRAEEDGRVFFVQYRETIQKLVEEAEQDAGKIDQFLKWLRKDWSDDEQEDMMESLWCHHFEDPSASRRTLLRRLVERIEQGTTGKSLRMWDGIIHIATTQERVVNDATLQRLLQWAEKRKDADMIYWIDSEIFDRAEQQSQQTA